MLTVERRMKSTHLENLDFVLTHLVAANLLVKSSIKVDE